MRRILVPIALACGPILASARPAAAQVTAIAPDPPAPPAAAAAAAVAEPTVLTLRPAAAPDPALKYRLVPERIELTPGNAAIFYHRAIQREMTNRTRLDAETKPGSKAQTSSILISDWVSGPIGEIPRDEAKTMLDAFQYVLREVELGAFRQTCDWEFDLRQDGISLIISEIQEMRTLARLVALRARLAILDGKTDEALHWIEVGFVMGRHVAHGPTVIQALVGMAIDFVMTNCLVDLIQAPGTPSLYWALADRPRPFIDMRYPLEGERYLLEKELPKLRDLDGEPWSLDQARSFVDEMQSKLLGLISGEPLPGGGVVPTGLPATARRLAIAAMAAKIYPEARRSLIARGRAEAAVEAMPVVQVAALASLLDYRSLRDETYKWMNLPYWQSYDRVDRSFQEVAKERLANPLLAMFRMLTPALASARLASVRLDRQLDALQCVEAIRLHAASHGGTLPANLAAIDEAPVPSDPATGKPFEYRVDGETATLSAPLPPGAPDHPSYLIRYRLKVVR